MTERRMGRRGLLGLLARSPEPDAIASPAPAPPVRFPISDPEGATGAVDSFSIASFYAARAIAHQPSGDTIPAFELRSDLSVETTLVGTPELAPQRPLPPWARPTASRLPPDRVPRVRPHTCLAHRGICSVCSEHCPVEGAIMVQLGRPVVDPSKCDGCGACIGACPAPVNGFELVVRSGVRGSNV